jgi:hypothetical protein
MLEIPLFSPTTYQLYKLLPFPISVKEEECTYSYIHFNKEFIFSDPLRQHFGRMTANELTGCFHPNEFIYVFIFIFIYLHSVNPYKVKVTYRT